MAPIRWFSSHASWLARTLLGGCLAVLLTAAPASAEISSVDAYGGQAQVLGKPVHHHHRAAGGSSGAQGSGRESGNSTGTSGSAAGGGGSAESMSRSTSGSSSRAPATPNGLHSANDAGGATTGGGGGGGAGSHGGATTAGAGGTGAASGVSGTGQSPPIAAANVAEVSNGSLSLSALDVLLLVAVFIALAGVGVLIRRWSHQEPLSK